jgi:hypothetical protein
MTAKRQVSLDEPARPVVRFCLTEREEAKPMVVTDPQTWVANHDPLTVVPLHDPVVEAVGHDPRSAYVESFWTPILGPSAVMGARHLSAQLEDAPEGVTVSLVVLARQLGLGAVPAATPH